MINEKERLDQACEDFLDRAMELYDIPGIVAGAFTEGGACRFTGARGYKNFVTKTPLRAEHVFHCGSVSKLFTSMGIMKLVEEGRLNLEDRLVELLPYLSIADRRCENITLRQMLTHTAGLGDVEDYHWDTPRTDAAALRDYALSQEVRDTPMLWAPGEGGFRYSNMAYELLGLIAAEYSGETYETYMEKHFLEPAAMKDSTFLTFERTGGSLTLEAVEKTEMAMPHRKAEDRSIVLEAHYPYNREHAPSSTLTSNAEDLLRWAEINLKRAVVSAALYDEIWQEYAVVPNNGEKMGLGWFMREQEGQILVGHEGTDDGFRASFWFCPELGVATVVLSNLSKAPVKRLNKQLFEILVKG